MADKCVVLLSGGMDSAVLMYSLIEKYEVYPLSLMYGQRHNKEVIAARNLCEARGDWLLARWKFVDLDVLKLLLPSALTGQSDIPVGYYTSEGMKATVVPNRNMILLAIASGYASGIGAKYVAYGAHKGDHAIYPDCRYEFVDSMRCSIKLGTGWESDGVELLTPFIGKDKKDIVLLGKKYTVPFKLTWSCYSGLDRPCLKCGTCVERTEAFYEAETSDPALSPAEWVEALIYLSKHS